MENLRITIAAGETKVFIKAGRYFEIIDSTGPVILSFYDANGSQNNDASNVLSGFYLAESYSQFDIYSATAQTVEIFISEATAGSKRQPGVVSITNRIGEGIAQTFGVGNLALGTNVTQIVAPALNTKGIQIRSVATATGGSAGGNASTRFVCAPTAPAGSYPTNGYSFCTATAAGAITTIKELDQQNFILPPGWGIWLVNTNVAVAPISSNYELAYELVK